MPEIELDLKKHCIETAIKRSYNRLLSEYLQSRVGDTESEEKLGLLQNALASFDFSFLRAVYGELAGNSKARIVLLENDNGLPGISIDGRIIDAGRFVRNEKAP